MTTIALPLESDKISDKLEDEPISDNGSDKFELSLPKAGEVVSSPSSESLASSTNLNDENTKEISVTDDEKTSSQEVEKNIDNEVDEPKTINPIDGCFDDVDETSSSQKQSQGKVENDSEDQITNEQKIDNLRVDESELINSQKQSQEKVDNDGEDTNEPKINKDNEKLLDSEDNDDDVQASFKNNNKSSSSNSRKLFPFLDSDSEDENIFTSKPQDNEETGSISGISGSTDSPTKSKKKSRLKNIVDSDSDDDSANNVGGEKSQDEVQKPNFKKLAILDSDSEDENFNRKSSENESDDSSKKNNTNKKSKKVSNVIRDLVDSEDSEPDNRNESNKVLPDDSDGEKNVKKSQKKSEKKRKGSARASKDAAMHQIKSESQRLLRESEVSLPYHRPKQRTLQEFLNRKKISSSLPKAPTTAAKVKMFDDLIIKAVEEKEKEAEMFYKSSDSEEETQLTNKIEGVDKTQDSTDFNLEIGDLEKTQMDVDPPIGNDQQLDSDFPDVPVNLNSTEQNIENVQGQYNLDKTEETAMECIVEKNISDVSRRLFFDGKENVIENEISEKSNEEIQEESVSQGVEDENNTINPEDNTAMETDTNDFELKFSVNDFDTNLNIKELVSDAEGAEPSTETVDNEESELEKTEVNGDSEVDQEERIDDDGLEPSIPKGQILGLPPPDFDDDVDKKKTLKKKISSRLLNFTPTLHGSPGTTIELTEKTEVDHEGVKRLLDRFVRHSHVHKTEENSDVTVIHTEVTSDGLKITEQTLAYKIANSTEDSELNKPGAKFQKLKEELQQKISDRRNEEWRQKEEASKALDEYLAEEMEPEDKDDLLPDEEEELDDEEAESELEENDILIKENEKLKCAFADDEAEVSDDNEGIEDTQVNEDDEEEEDEENEDADEEDAGEDDEEDEDENQENNDEHPKKLRRILTAFEDDSDHSETETTNLEEEVKEEAKKTFQRTKTDVDMFDDVSDGWTSDIEGENRPRTVASENLVCQTPLVIPNQLSLVSPITQLTALKKSSTSAKDDSESKYSDPLNQLNDSMSQESTSAEKGPNLEKWCGLKKNLFHDSADAVNDDELMDLCSGKFTATPQVGKSVEPLMNPLQKEVTDSQLLDLCSGSFASQPIDENSQDMKLTLDEESKSPIKYSPKKTVGVESVGSRLKVVSSDEEDETAKEENEKKRKKIAKLVLSDDEDEENEPGEYDLSEEEEEIEQEDEEKFVDYDSEENEVVVIPKKDIKKVAAKFVDAEAELSESDWDSADEDERDLDKLEKEEGDDDVIDEDQMRSQLGKLHARQLLDDDQRDVRLLQDMLFEDGDLHSDGAGRERKFKWKNIDKLGNEWADSKGPEDPDLITDALEDTSELELRKHRYEQQKFLEKQKKDPNDDIEEDLNDSQIFKFGLKFVSTAKSSSSRVEGTSSGNVMKPLATSIIPSLLGKSAKSKSSPGQLPIRGSFLARGEATLARIASVIDEKDRVIRAPSNGRRFVFEHISPSVHDAEESKTDETDSTSKKWPRKRTSTSDSTPKSAKKMKINEERSAGKKLFD